MMRIGLSLLLICGPALQTVVAGVNTWSVKGPEGGPVYAAYYVPGTAGVAVAAAGNRIYRTTNNGLTWSRLSITLLNPAISIVGDPADANLVVLLAGGEGLFRSDDAGMSFAATGRFAQNDGAEQSIAISSNGQVWYGGTLNGSVYRSTDKGLTWIRRSDGLSQVNGAVVDELVINPQNADHVYAVVKTVSSGSSTISSTIHVTLDGGLHWSPVSGLDCAAVSCWSIAIDPSNPNRLIVAGLYGFHFSSDGGTLWTARSVGGPYTLIRFDPNVAGRAYALTSTGVVYRTLDAGQSWSQVARAHAYNIHDLAFDRLSTGRLLLATSEGVFLSEDGASSWTRRSAGISAYSPIRLTAGTIGGQSRVLSSGLGPHGVFSRHSVAFEWSPLGRESLQSHFANGVDIRATAWDPSDPNIIYAAGVGGVLKSQTGGATWLKPSVALDNDVVFDLAVDPQNPQTLYVATVARGVFRSANGGATWFSRSSGLPVTAISTLAIDPQNSQVVYAGTTAPANQGVFKSIDGGANWVAANVGMESANVFKLALDPTTPAVLYAATTNGTFKSSNGGAAWTRLIGDGMSWDVAVDPNVTSNIYRARPAALGLERSVDGGQSWERIAFSQPPRLVVLDPARTSNVIASAEPDGIAELEVTPDLALSSSANTFVLGSAQTLTFRVINNGPYAASSVELVSALPTNSTDKAAQTDRGTCAMTGDSVRCRIGALKVSEAANVSITLRSDASGSMTTAVSAHERELISTDNSLVITSTSSSGVNGPAPAPQSSGGGGGAWSCLWLMCLASMLAIRARAKRCALMG